VRGIHARTHARLDSRFYAIFCFYDSLSKLAVAVLCLPALRSFSDYADTLAPWTLIVFPTLMLVFSIVLWLFATRISGAIVRGHDAEVTAITLTREELYRFAFVFLGLYFIFSSISGVVDAGYSFIVNDALLPQTDPHRGKEVLPFVCRSLSMMVGLASVFGASKWTRRLIKREEASDQSRNLPG
jgi:hypothetical protein